MDLHMLRLLDIYSPLLTGHQREVTDLYFNYDLSLAEIAEQKGCSRQSVSDTLQKARRQLEEYEEKLHVCRTLAETSLAQSLMLAKVGKWAEEALSPAQCAQLKQLTDRDYSGEAKAIFEADPEKLI